MMTRHNEMVTTISRGLQPSRTAGDADPMTTEAPSGTRDWLTMANVTSETPMGNRDAIPFEDREQA